MVRLNHTDKHGKTGQLRSRFTSYRDLFELLMHFIWRHPALTQQSFPGNQVNVLLWIFGVT